MKILKHKTFRKIFLIRFLGYFFILTGIVMLIITVEPVVFEEVRYSANNLTGKKHRLAPQIVTSATLNQGSNPEVSPTPGAPAAPTSAPSEPEPGFGSLIGGGSEVIVPVSTDFGIVIEKINANAKVVANVSPADEKEYSQALVKGVAHAKGTAFPGQKGNIYLFSHSVDAPWNIVRYNAIFYLLNKLEPDDQISIFYQGRRYDYKVYDKTIAKPQDTHFITNSYDEEVLTLQTCDPPGTLLNRLVIRAKLV